MHLILLAVGALMVAAGFMMIRSAVPLDEGTGAAWLTPGFILLVGGIVVAALAAAVRNLGRIAERLEIQPLPLPPMASLGREDPVPRPVRAPVAASGPSLLGWLGRTPAPAPVAPPRAAPEKKAEPAPVDLGPLTQIPEPLRAPPPSPPPPVPPMRPLPRSVPVAPPPLSQPQSAPAPAVYRSGVIDGMAYTLFMDGSIAAELPQGKVKFATIDELQKYLVEKGAV